MWTKIKVPPFTVVFSSMASILAGENKYSFTIFGFMEESKQVRMEQRTSSKTSLGNSARKK
jgi:hypothetical protein